MATLKELGELIDARTPREIIKALNNESHAIGPSYDLRLESNLWFNQE